MSFYAIYTYEFERIIRSNNRELQFEIFPSPVCTDDEWERRQETFREFFKIGQPLSERTFKKGSSTYVYDIIFSEGNIAIMKFGRLSNKLIRDDTLNDHIIDDYPWCYVVFDNRDDIQRMLIEQKTSAWPNSKTINGTRKVAKALKYIIDEWLYKYKGMHFNYGDGPVYKSDDFWDCLKRYPQGFSRVHFSFPPPNLGRLMDLADNFMAIRKETGGGIETELKAPKGGVLTLIPENPQTQSLVNLSSACGSETKVYPKGGHTMVKISGDNPENDVAVEIPDSLIPLLTSPQLFAKENFSQLIEIVNSIKNLY